jgi:pimeloyl-ACP methyl ester carboxylesterase
MLAHPQQPPVTTVNATVHAGGRATTYQRAGAGAPVLVLLDQDVPQLAHMAAQLSHRFRIITTDGNAPSHEYAQWLADFLDGLGLHNTVIITSGVQSGAAVAFAMHHPGRVPLVVAVGAAHHAGKSIEGGPVVRAVSMEHAIPELVRAATHAIEACSHSHIAFHSLTDRGDRAAKENS